MDCWVRLNFSANACWLKHCGDNSYVVSVKSAKDINITECDLYGCGNNYIYSSEPLVEIEYQKNMNNMKRVEFKNCKIFNDHSSDFTRDEAAVKLEKYMGRKKSSGIWHLFKRYYMAGGWGKS